jgi:hypothetical protein
MDGSYKHVMNTRIMSAGCLLAKPNIQPVGVLLGQVTNGGDAEQLEIRKRGRPDISQLGGQDGCVVVDHACM